MELLGELFQRAVELPASEQDGFLLDKCGSDKELLAAARRLLAGDRAADASPFWGMSAMEVEAMHGGEVATEDSRIGQTLGDYRVVEVVGEGGMGSVYRAVRADSAYSQSVAIKLVRSGMASSRMAERSRQERQILANLEHPNIARLLDGGTSPDGLPFLVMEFIEGEPLTEYCRRKKLGLVEKLKLFRQVCAAVEYAHQRLVIHRDLKPGNILVNQTGEVKLLDFGVAKLLEPDLNEPLQAETVALHWLTPGYASPEQIRGEAMTTVSDVYSLGVILYELLTGRSPYRKPMKPLTEALRTVCDEDPLPPSASVANDVAGKSLARKLRGDLDNIALMALRKEPKRRYVSVEQFEGDIRRYLEGLPVRARGDALMYRAGKFVRRNRIAVAAAVALLVVLSGGIVATSRAEARAKRQFAAVRHLAHSVLFDYHDAIEGLPGSTPVRQRLVKDALGYLDGLSKEEDEPGLEREIVEAYVKIADVQGNSYDSNLGDTAGAMDSARKAVAHGERLYARDSSSENAFVLGRAYQALAEMIHGSSQPADAAKYYAQAEALQEKAAASQPSDPTLRLQQIQVLQHWGDLLGSQGMSNLGRSGESLLRYQKALSLSNQLMQSHPGVRPVRQAQFESQLDATSAERSLGHASVAEAGYRRAVAIADEITPPGTGTTEERFEVASTQLYLVRQLVDNGKPQEAIPFAEKTAAIAGELAAADPKSVLYQRSLATGELQVCNALRAAGRAAEGIPHCRKALAILEPLNAADPTSGEYRSDVANAHWKLGAALMSSGDASSALPQLRRALAILDETPAATADANHRINLMRTSVTVGDAEHALGDENASLAAYRRATDIAERLVRDDPDQAYNKLDRARCKTRLAQSLAGAGHCSDAEPLFTEAIAEWNVLRDIGILPPSDKGQPEVLEVALHRCQSLDAH